MDLLYLIGLAVIAVVLAVQAVLSARRARELRSYLNGLLGVTNDTHALVNSSMGVQLRVSWLALKRVAELTGHPDDREAAEASSRMLDEHDKRQLHADLRKAEGL